jgi:hypothetical protein
VSWLGRGLGDFGSQVGQGYDINLGWKERLQGLAMEQARQKNADMKNALDMQELQTRIKQMQSPQPAGIVKGPGGEESGVTWDPITSTYSAKTLIPGAPPEPKFKTPLEAMTYYAQKGDAERFNQFKTIYESTRPQPKVQEGYTEIRPDTKGNLWGVNKTTGKFEQIPSSAKFPIPHEGAGSAPGDVDALAYDISAGRGTMPTGKFGAAVATRMKQLGLEPPVKDQKEVIKAAEAAQRAMVASQSVDRIMKNSNLTPSDALNIAGIYDKLKGTHVATDWKTRLDSTFSFRPSKREISELAEEIKNSMDDVRQQAIDAYKYAGMPVPPALMGGDLSDLGARPSK